MPPRLTSRDQSITAWVARWQPVTGYQVARAFGVHYVIATRRLASLRKLGYVSSQRPVQQLPGIYSVTNHGFGLIGVRARGMRVNPFNLWGDLATVDQVVDDQLAGATVLTSTEVQTRPGIQEQMPTIEDYDEPILTDAEVRPALEFTFAHQPNVAIVSVDPHFIGGSHAQ